MFMPVTAQCRAVKCIFYALPLIANTNTFKVLKKGLKYILWVALALVFYTSAAQQNQAFRHQLALIDSLRQFVVDDLKLNTGNDFYLHWDKSIDSMYSYLYISDANRIHEPDSFSSLSGRSYSADSARILSNQFQAAGYETLVYRTAGNSNARMNAKLLSYPDEAIAFIVFHEATHRHLRSGAVHLIPYEYEEAFCDAIANRACNLFADKTGMLSVPAVRAQAACFESIYKLLNTTEPKVDSLPKDRGKTILNDCTRIVWHKAEKGNQFVKDRMQYPVNHAYFIRTIPYSKHYFEIKNWLGGGIDVKHAVDEIAARFKSKTSH